MMKLLTTVLFLLALLPSSQAAESSNWPQWRGPGGRGISPEKGVTTSWSPGSNVKWKAPIPGKGHSSPIVWDRFVVLTATVQGSLLEGGPTAVEHKMNGEDFKHPQWAGSDHSWAFKVICLDRDSGRVLWEQTAYDGTVYDHIHEQGSYATATPVTDGKFIYVYFGSEGIFCYDFNGKLVWKTSLGGIGTVGMGVGSSPVLYEDKLILVCDQEFDGSLSFMVALDKATGKELWRVDRSARVTWATPILVSDRSKPELVVSGAEKVISYDPSTGNTLWSAPGVVSHALPSPVTDGEVVFVSAGAQAKRTMAVRLGATGDLEEGSASILWEYGKGAAYVPSPIFYQGHFYLISDRGVITCLDSRTGAVLYEDRVPEASSFKSSLVAVDGKLMASSQEGKTFVISAGPEFKVIETNSVDESVWASLAISQGTVYIRGDEHLFAIGSGDTVPAGESQ